MTTDDLFEILVFHASVSGLDEMDEHLQPQYGRSLAAARHAQAGVCVVAGVAWKFLPYLAFSYSENWIFFFCFFGVFLLQVRMPNA